MSTRESPAGADGAITEVKDTTESIVAHLRRRRAAVVECRLVDPLDELAKLPIGETDFGRYDCQRQFVTDPVTVVRLSCVRGCRDACERFEGASS